MLIGELQRWLAVALARTSNTHKARTAVTGLWCRTALADKVLSKYLWFLHCEDRRVHCVALVYFLCHAVLVGRPLCLDSGRSSSECGHCTCTCCTCCTCSRANFGGQQRHARNATKERTGLLKPWYLSFWTLKLLCLMWWLTSPSGLGIGMTQNDSDWETKERRERCCAKMCEGSRLEIFGMSFSGQVPCFSPWRPQRCSRGVGKLEKVRLQLQRSKEKMHFFNSCLRLPSITLDCLRWP